MYKKIRDIVKKLDKRRNFIYNIYSLYIRGYLEIKPEITGAEVQSILWERSPDLDDLQAIRLVREMPPTIIKSVKLMAKTGGDSILWVSIEPSQMGIDEC
ncbi:MAG: hypothetical protein U9R01_09370 [candidate division WOR-3 bacterium]|nr:hypothetical protein [candidate division WOR-3 bacterium]